MSELAIKFDNVSKQYRLGLIGTGTISHDLNRWWHKVRGLDDPYLKIGETNDRSAKATSEYVWALRDITFDVKQGEVLGIIGKNGAGKSTLLKILSRVTSPTTGSIKAKGRIASLLEVGTGFHPEMTGRENIYMNGAIMGMTKSEIKSKLDEIVSFAGVEKYIDTPVKRYSSGMTVRLGFAIAAHLEPEILVVDEVLAVGDAEFQKKAIGKMQDVSKGEGRTVLFVSHNMASVKALCTNGIILKNGSVHSSGDIDNIVRQYLTINQENLETGVRLSDRTFREGNQQAYFSDIRLIQDDMVTTNVPTGSSIEFEIEIKSTEIVKNPVIFLSVYNNDEFQLIHTNTNITAEKQIILNKGINRLRCQFDLFPLQIGSYYVNVAMDDSMGKRLDRVERALEIEVLENNVYESGKLQGRHQGLFILPNKWSQI